jgi:hypothetical protein
MNLEQRLDSIIESGVARIQSEAEIEAQQQKQRNDLLKHAEKFKAEAKTNVKKTVVFAGALIEQYLRQDRIEDAEAVVAGVRAYKTTLAGM